MANSMGRSVKKGEVVILKKDIFKPEFQADRRAEVLGGFGMNNFTSGTALFVRFLVDGEETRMSGYDIDKEETEAFQKQNESGKCPNCGSADVSTGRDNHVGLCSSCDHQWPTA